MKQLVSLLGSMKTMVVLMLIFAFSIAWATFMENDYGTITAKADVYNARWFEVLLFFLGVNLVLNIFNYKMFMLKKAPVFIFHVAFLIILFGSFITRYVGYEGTMHIREGQSASTMISSKTFFTLKIKTSNDKYTKSKPFFVSKRLDNSLSFSADIEGKDVFVELIKYIPNAVLLDVSDKNKTAVTNPNIPLRESGRDAFEFKVTINGKTKKMLVFGQSGVKAKEYHILLDGVDVSLSYGAKVMKLPFEIYLKDFQLDRYPGSMSPSSYASEVVLVDKNKGVNMPYRIYMNHILNYDGFRFFQASYDLDEKGTILSVNHDPGTLPSYIGYALLIIGMFWSLFSRKNRFAQLAKTLKKATNTKAVGLFLSAGMVLFGSIPAYASDTGIFVNKAHAKKFAQLIVQDSSGRMKPVDTLSLEILAKIHRGSTVEIAGRTMDANQVVLGMMVRPDDYRNVKLIRSKKSVNKIIGVDEKDKYVSFAQFFEDPVKMQGYKLFDYVDRAIRKQPKDRNMLDKDVLKIDEKVNIVYSVFTGSLFRIWPKPNDINNKWYPTIEALQTFSPEDSNRLRDIAGDYFRSIGEALSSGKWSHADETIEKIAKYQKFYGAEVCPSANRIKAEIFYNHANIFESLFPLYFLVGFVLLIFSFIKIIKPKFNITFISRISLVFLVFFFFAHTFGLALRWYISGHAPWSNGYESMIYIGWATVLAGFIFSKKSPIAMASTSIMTGLILFVAHLSWMDPQVTNLVPVLNSYWLSLHVAVITASYGFLGLGALLGFIVLLLFVFKTKANEKQLGLSIKELNAINEMGLMIGLVLLTVGNFLGGIWANESWGRYWGWDPKETWALVSILVYGVVVHLRFIKSIYSEFSFSVVSLLSFTSVLMTYFGVNYYLAGMHSYAKGDPVPIPDFVPITYFVIFLIIVLAYVRNTALKDKVSNR